MMELVQKPITKEELLVMSKKGFGDLVKGVVDIVKEIMVVDGSLHSDEEAFLINNGSTQQNLWGINLYPELDGENFIEFDSMINLRPSQGNRSRSVDDEAVRKKIIIIVTKLVV